MPFFYRLGKQTLNCNAFQNINQDLSYIFISLIENFEFLLCYHIPRKWFINNAPFHYNDNVKQAYFICRMKQTKSAIPSICNFNKAGISEFGSDLEQLPRGYANDCC